MVVGRFGRLLATAMTIALVSMTFVPSSMAAHIDDFVLVDGPGAGTHVFAKDHHVGPGHNRLTDATGKIVKPTAGCDELHYAGSIDGHDGTDVNCGWGRVIRTGQMTDPMTNVSDAITAERRARGEHDGQDYTGSTADLADAKSKLEKVHDDLVDLHIDPEILAQIDALIDAVKADDDNAIAEDSSTGDALDFAVALQKGLDDKAKLVVGLSENNLAEDRTAPPFVSEIFAKFHPSPVAGCNRKRYPHSCLTKYAAEAHPPARHVRVTASLELTPPLVDATCKHFSTSSGEDQDYFGTWLHADEDDCDHTKQGVNGHEGVVTFTAKTDRWTCVAIFIGTAPNTTPNQGEPGPDPTCFPSTGHVITVVKVSPGSVPGTGEVTDGEDIDCPTGCAFASASYPDSHPLTYTASPDSGSTFTGWSGAGCSGTGDCDILAVDDETILATFTHT